MAAKWIKLRDGLCHQGGGFQIWAKVVPSLLLSLFFPPSPFLPCQFSWVRVGGALGLEN